MINKPTNTIDWNAPVAKVSEPTTPEKANGWGISQKPPAYQYNWFNNLNTDWAKFADENMGNYSQLLEITANHTLLDNDNIGTVTVTGGTSLLELTLPACSDNLNRLLFIRKTDATGELTITPNGTDTINNDNEYKIYSSLGIILVAIGTNWFLLSNNLTSFEIALGNKTDFINEITLVDTDVACRVDRVLEKLISNTWSLISGTGAYATRYSGGCGTVNAALNMGGITTGTTSILNTFSFNGIAWSIVDSLSSARHGLGACGIQNAALAIGGQYFSGVTPVEISTTEVFNGTVWATSGSLVGHARALIPGIGTVNAAMTVGGMYTGGTLTSNLCERRSSTVWLVGTNINTWKSSVAGAGTQNANIIAGGYFSGSTTFMNSTEIFNGNLFIAAMNISAQKSTMGMSGTANATIVFGGLDSSSTLDTVEKFNGYVWSQTADMLNITGAPASSGTQNLALSQGGEGSTGLSMDVTAKFRGEFDFDIITSFFGDEDIEYYTSDADTHLNKTGEVVIEVVTKPYTSEFEVIDLTELRLGGYSDYVWSILAATTANSKRAACGCGVQNAALVFGGLNGANWYLETEEYNGITWTLRGDLSTAKLMAMSTGTVNAGLSFGGWFFSDLLLTEKFNGLIWTTSGNLTSSRYYSGASGVQNAALAFGGLATSVTLDTFESFNGTTWTALSGTLPNTIFQSSGTGTQNAALSIVGGAWTGGFGVGGTAVYKFNGSSWSVATPANIIRALAGAAGFQNNSTVAGGKIETGNIYLSSVEKYNGIYWYMLNEMNESRGSAGVAGTATSIMLTTGENPISTYDTATIMSDNYGTNYQDICEKTLII